MPLCHASQIAHMSEGPRIHFPFTTPTLEVVLVPTQAGALIASPKHRTRQIDYPQNTLGAMLGALHTVQYDDLRYCFFFFMTAVPFACASLAEAPADR